MVKSSIPNKLKIARIAKNLSVYILSYETGIKEDYLVYLEEGEFDKFDNLSDVIRYVKIYADFLGLDGYNLSKIVERDINLHLYKPKKKLSYKIKASVVQKVSKTKNNSLLKLFNKILTYNKFLKFIFLFILIFLIGNYFISSFFNTVRPPIVHIYEPFEIKFEEGNQSINFSGQKITLKGNVIGVGELKANNKVIPQYPGGFFEIKDIPLFELDNYVVFETKNLYGSINRSILNIKRQDLISYRDEEKYITVIAGDMARFVLVRIDDEIVYNDTVVPNQILGFKIDKKIKIETSQFDQFKIRYMGKEYKLTSEIQSFEIFQDNLIKLN